MDDRMIRERHNVKKTLHSPERFEGNPVLGRSEAHLFPIISGSVFRDPQTGLFRMWYGTGLHIKNGYAVAYAESEDGIHWERPEFDVILFDGRGTNVLMVWCSPADVARGGDIIPALRDETEGNHSVVIKYPCNQEMAAFGGMANILWEPEDPDPDRRYKGFFRLAPKPDLSSFLCTSPDGIHWKRGAELPEICDTSCLMRDEVKGKWVVYSRYWDENMIRHIGYTESDDFVTWTVPKLIFSLDDKDIPRAEAYDMQVYHCGASYLGLLRIYDTITETQNFQLVTSRDGLHFERVAGRETWFDLAPMGEWDRFRLDMAARPVRVGDELWFYYGGRMYRHGEHRDHGVSSGHIGIARLRPDGYVSLDGSFDGAYVVLAASRLEGRRLYLNAYARFGRITLDLQREDGSSLPGYSSLPIEGDSLTHPVRFEKDLSGLNDRPVRIRVNLTNARLYSLWCE